MWIVDVTNAANIWTKFWYQETRTTKCEQAFLLPGIKNDDML